MDKETVRVGKSYKEADTLRRRETLKKKKCRIVTEFNEERGKLLECRSEKRQT